MLAGEFRTEQLYISDANIVDSQRGGMFFNPEYPLRR